MVQEQHAVELLQHRLRTRLQGLVRLMYMSFVLITNQFNGTITNDKFCMSRMGQLRLSWWRLPLQARVAVTKETAYPADANEL
jgi:hypothetical protein